MPKEQTDEELLQCVGRKKDPDAFRMLAERYGDFVYSLAARSLGRDRDAEDASQISWIEVLRSAERFEPRGDGSARAWIARIALRKALNMRRSQIRSRQREMENAAETFLAP